MNLQLHDAMHRHRAEQFERDATADALARRLRRAKRLERAARWSQRCADALAARARASHAHLP